MIFERTPRAKALLRFPPFLDDVFTESDRTMRPQKEDYDVFPAELLVGDVCRSAAVMCSRARSLSYVTKARINRKKKFTGAFYAGSTRFKVVGGSQQTTFTDI